MKELKESSKRLAVLWTILAIVALVSALKQFFRRFETGDRAGEVVLFLMFVLPYTYVAVLNWRSYFKTKSKNGEKETEVE
jgi:hypothetical protein